LDNCNGADFDGNFPAFSQAYQEGIRPAIPEEHNDVRTATAPFGANEAGEEVDVGISRLLPRHPQLSDVFEFAQITNRLESDLLNRSF
jgi:hypothetical protein